MVRRRYPISSVHILGCAILALLTRNPFASASASTLLSPISCGIRSVLESRSSCQRPSLIRPVLANDCTHPDSAPLKSLWNYDSSEKLAENAYLRNGSETDDDSEVLAVHHCRSTPGAVPQQHASLPIPAKRLAESRGGAAAIAVRPLLFWETMICGAISRSIAQTVLHPANTMKTMLQNSRGGTLTIAELAQPKYFRRLSVGAGANFILSVPHGAVNFAVLEVVRRNLQAATERSPFLKRNSERLGPGLDFFSSCISTITCSVVSTPQMMITDNIMAGNYPNLPKAIAGLASEQGVRGFYRGWWPGLVGKIPSYALTWTFFQQMKRIRDRVSDKPATDLGNSALGCIASATTVIIMIPMDTVKTRLVTQVVGSETAYKGVVDCAVRVFREEGLATFYRGLPPRLVSVVPMIGIQFGIYEAMKKVMLQRRAENATKKKLEDDFGRRRVFAEAAMEVAASPEHPYPAPHFLKRFKDRRQKP